jgi:hypothetical protein
MRASKNANAKYKNCLSHFSVYRPSLKGITIRHPPQAFPLGLLAPRLLGVLLFLAIPALRSGGEGRTAVWGEEGILSPASVSSSQMLFGVFSALYCFSLCYALWLRLMCLRSPPSHNPSPRFHIRVYFYSRVLRFLLRRRSSFSPGRPSGNA